MKQIGDLLDGFLCLLISLGYIVIAALALASGNKSAIIIVAIIGGIFIVIAIIGEDKRPKVIVELVKKSVKTIPPTPDLSKKKEIPQLIIDESNVKSKNLRNKWVEKQKELIVEYESLLELLKTKPINSIKYGNLLNCFEWKSLRFRILIRDNFCCVDCNRRSYGLHVHHKYYLKDSLPWETEDSTLISLCRGCHTKRHRDEEIKVYKKDGTQLTSSKHQYFHICTRCQGIGYIPRYKHVEDGICFLCWGAGSFINNSIFHDRILQIKNVPNSYDLNERFDDCFNFFDSISIEFYKNNVQDKLEFELAEPNFSQYELDDLPF